MNGIVEFVYYNFQQSNNLEGQTSLMVLLIRLDYLQDFLLEKQV